MVGIPPQRLVGMAQESSDYFVNDVMGVPMRKKYIHTVGSIIIGFFILSACTGELANNSEPTLLISPIAATRTLQIIQTLPPTLTPIPSPSVTPSPIITPTITPKVVINPPTSTVTAPIQAPMIPTLSVEEADVFLRELMANNGGCELPCWWGVVPGETTEQVAHDMFLSWGIREWVISEAYRSVNLGYARPDFPHYIPDVSVNMWVENNLVQYISISGQKPKQELELQFIEDWQQYSLSNILEQYGVPTHVRLESIPPDRSSTTYILGLSYPSLGIEVSYVIEAEYIDNQQHLICPDFAHFNFIILDLYSPDYGTHVPEYIIPNNLEEYISWEVSTGSSIESFYETYHHTDEISCITLTP